jgi:hypothetical protein
MVDKYGIPVLRFNTSHSEYEIKQARHMKKTFKEILQAMGAEKTWGANDGRKITGVSMLPATSSMKPARYAWAMIPGHPH